MTAPITPRGGAAPPVTIDRDGLAQLIGTLRDSGFETVGPTVRDEAIVHESIESVSDLPIGWGDEQGAGRYRLRHRDDRAAFGFASSPHSWKPFLFPARERLWRAARGAGGELAFADSAADEDAARRTRFAFIGVRACDLAAIAIQDRVFMPGEVADPHYAARRRDAFIVAVNCGEAGATCFCDSMGTGPAVAGGFDLALTELLDADVRYLVEIGSEGGAEIMAHVSHRPATEADRSAAGAVVERARSTMGRTLDAGGVRERLYGAFEHPRWEQIAERCLSCANCTLVCPTCFCHSVRDTSDLAGTTAEAWREWDSCFGLDHSFVAGGPARAGTAARYRQWLTHKLATWHEQFGTSGCVGCGRCITWCPVAIDITAEVAAIANSPARGNEAAAPTVEGDAGAKREGGA